MRRCFLQHCHRKRLERVKLLTLRELIKQTVIVPAVELCAEVETSEVDLRVLICNNLRYVSK